MMMVNFDQRGMFRELLTELRFSSLAGVGPARRLDMGIDQKAATMFPKRALLGLALTATVGLTIGLAMSSPASAASGMSGAEKLRRLDIMLMVTALRCRSTPDNFTADYSAFTSSHMHELNQSNAQLRSELSARRGAGGADRALDRLSTTMANRYGQGHPRLDCAQLKMATRNLAQVRGRAALEEAADQLLDDGSSSELAYSRR
jgi:hypothetical protein